MTREESETMSIELYRDSIIVASIIEKVETMARNGNQCIDDEEMSYEQIALEGPKFMTALRAIATRLDRSVVSKY